MRKHNGMRPQDVVLLLRIITTRHDGWRIKDLAQATGISSSEISASLERSVFAGLIKTDKRKVVRRALHEFLVHGIRYVFPVRPGILTQGMETAYSIFPSSEHTIDTHKYVWPDPKGKTTGLAIEPLIDAVPFACSQDPALYELLALIDTLRIGKAMEKSIAEIELEKRIWREAQWINFQMEESPTD
jgi:hypothetical protein